jgi:hypothetical protein
MGKEEMWGCKAASRLAQRSEGEGMPPAVVTRTPLHEFISNRRLKVAAKEKENEESKTCLLVKFTLLCMRQNNPYYTCSVHIKSPNWHLGLIATFKRTNCGTKI